MKVHLEILLAGVVSGFCSLLPAQWALQSGPGPEARAAAALAYHAASEKVVLFGGLKPATMLADTWEWDGSTWTQRLVAGPPPRAISAMAEDTVRGRLVLYGGWQASVATGSTRLTDTWEWDGATWAEATPAANPGTRERYSMAFDGSRTILFGGSSGGSTPVDLGDTWAWDGTNWTQLSPATSPPARAGHHMVQDGNSVLLFGGYENTVSGSIPFLDMWRWNGSTWSQVTGISGFAATDFPGASSSRGSFPNDIITFGGAAAWFIDLAVGESITFPGCITANSFGVVAFDPGPRDTARGFDGLNTWSILNGGTPGPRLLHSQAFHAGLNQVVVFGGATATPVNSNLSCRFVRQFTDETWTLTGATAVGERTWMMYH